MGVVDITQVLSPPRYLFQVSIVDIRGVGLEVLTLPDPTTVSFLTVLMIIARLSLSRRPCTCDQVLYKLCDFEGLRDCRILGQYCVDQIQRLRSAERWCTIGCGRCLNSHSFC